MGFDGTRVDPLGVIDLSVTAAKRTLKENFVLTEIHHSYNLIMGKGWIHLMKGVPSTLHQVIRCLSPDGKEVINLWGDQVAAKECYMLTQVKAKRMSTQQQPGSSSTSEEKEALINVIRSNADAFAWDHSNMVGIDPIVSCHSLKVDPEFKPVKQKHRRFAPERNRIIAEEVNKLLQAGFIREVQYPQWLSNVVVVQKKNRKWRVCIDYTNLNKACPKDSYPLPKIDQMVDATTGYERVMPFGLKNAGGTYQRLVNKIFDNRLGKTVEAYIDDMVVKSVKKEDHPKHLQEVFNTLKKYNIKLNPSKCSFAVSSGQFLGHIVNKRGIEVSPAQAKALIQNQEPKNCKEVQQQEALSRLKGYMDEPPILFAPKPGEVLIMYLAISNTSTSAALIRNDGKRQYPIFYTSKTMTDAETRYSKAEKVILVLIYAKRKFRDYFESHSIMVLTNYPIRGILSKPDLSGRITKWAIELSSFDITYEPKVSHKGQAVADFLLEYEDTDTPEEPAHPEPQWELRVDGSSNQASAGVGVVMSTPEGTKLQQSICLKFPATNNEAEYEALLAGLRLACSLQVRCLKVFSDSQLVINQVTGQYHPKEERMKAYKEAVENVARGFDQIEFYQVPRVENAEADQLATSASSSNEDLIRIVPIDVLDGPSINPPQEVMVIPVIPREPCWIDLLETYLKHGALPDQKSKARKLRITATKYAIINNQLYRKSFSGPYLKCLSPTEALVVLRQIHDGDCGNHSGGRSLAHKVLTQGYLWPYLSWNAEEYTRRCDKCQRHGPMKHQSAEDLHAMANPWPFAQWGIDMVGSLPKTVEQKEYVLLATDYYNKWVEAEAYSSVTHEQGNGQAEITNRTIFSCLKKKLEKLKTKWYENLPRVLWAYRTTPRRPTGESPFAMAYGSEAVIPTEAAVL
ncbi:uncharacterized protein LOC132295604 [Cornus florida]|uniref:uncharacterized protein LOC132295604 n=1 Tax=Cornus florida TaxID=4283 RepID=UPI0028A16C7D|nr:uncharacterized protein LOC132295604 [Cornus florida]